MVTVGSGMDLTSVTASPHCPPRVLSLAAWRHAHPDCLPRRLALPASRSTCMCADCQGIRTGLSTLLLSSSFLPLPLTPCLLLRRLQGVSILLWLLCSSRPRPLYLILWFGLVLRALLAWDDSVLTLAKPTLSTSPINPFSDLHHSFHSSLLTIVDQAFATLRLPHTANVILRSFLLPSSINPFPKPRLSVPREISLSLSLSTYPENPPRHSKARENLTLTP